MVRLYLHAQQLLLLVRDERGQGLTEYALIIALVAVIAIAALGLFGGRVTTELSTIAKGV